MDFDFGKIAESVIALGAPVLGAALGGPLGGAAGKILADALGAPAATPAAIDKMLRQVPPERASAAVATAEAQWSEALKAEAELAGAALREINQTARAEAGSDDAFVRRARPMILYVYALVVALFCVILVAAVAVVVCRFDAAGISTALTALVGLIGALAMLLGVITVPATGYVYARSRDKQATLTGEVSPGVLGSLLNALKRAP
jgi:hypothetical protein